MKRSLIIVAVLISLAPVAGCKKAAGPQAAAPKPVQRVTNAALGIAIADLPQGFRVVENNDDGIILDRGSETDATLTITAGPLQPQGVNLIQAVNDEKPAFEAMKGGKFLGYRELRTPIGTAYTVRGRRAGEAGPQEIARVLTLDPSASRLLTLSYVYRADEDTKTRMEELLDVLAQIEPFETKPAGS